MKYRDWLQRWLSTGTITFKSATKNKYEQIIRCHINPFLGNREINDIAAEDLRNFSLRLASNTVKGILFVVKLSLQLALKNEILKDIVYQSILLTK